MNATVLQPTLFIPHGAGPCFFMEWNPPHTWDRTAAFLRGIEATLPHRPRAILMISAHWLQPVFTVTSGLQPDLIFDYHGFPPHTYELRYSAPGSPALAQRVAELLDAAGIDSAQDAHRGFDHGMFIPLLLMFPAADIPVVQLSLRDNLDPRTHIDVGRALAPLRAEEMLIVGSGMSFHNMRGYGDPRFGPISDQFDDWLTETVAANPVQREQRLLQWDNAPAARLSHPPRAEEHLLPLLVAAGAALDETGRKLFSDRVLETTVSAFRFG